MVSPLASGDGWRSLAFLDLQLHNSSLSLRHHMAVSHLCFTWPSFLRVCLFLCLFSSYKDIGHNGLRPTLLQYDLILISILIIFAKTNFKIRLHLWVPGLRSIWGKQFNPQHLFMIKCSSLRAMQFSCIYCFRKSQNNDIFVHLYISFVHYTPGFFCFLKPAKSFRKP